MDDFTEEEKEKIMSGTGTFYGSSLLFGEYLHHKGGSHLLKRIIEKVKSEGNVPFSELMKSHEALSTTIDDIEQDFHRYVAFTLGLPTVKD